MKYKPGDVVIYSIPKMGLDPDDIIELTYIVMVALSEDKKAVSYTYPYPYPYGSTYLVLADDGCYYYNETVFDKYTRLAHG